MHSLYAGALTLSGGQGWIDFFDASDPGAAPANGCYVWSSSTDGNLYKHRTGNTAKLIVDQGQVGVVTTPMIATQAVGSPIGVFNITGDVWSNVGLSAADNGISGANVNGTVPETGDLILMNVSASAVIQNPNVATWATWVCYIDGSFYRAGPMVYCPATGSGNQQSAVSWAATLLVAGPGTLAGGLSAGIHNFELRLRIQTAIANGGYLLCTSVPNMYRCQLEVWVIRR